MQQPQPQRKLLWQDEATRIRTVIRKGLEELGTEVFADLIVGDSIAKLRGQSNPARPPEVLAKMFESRYLLRLGRRYWLQYG